MSGAIHPQRAPHEIRLEERERVLDAVIAVLEQMVSTSPLQGDAVALRDVLPVLKAIRRNGPQVRGVNDARP